MNVKLVLAFVLPKASYLFVLLAFLQKFNVSENSLCMLFASDARRQLHNIFFIQFDDNIQTARQLHNAVFAKFFYKSYLLLLILRYRVIYFQCLSCASTVHS